MNRFQALLATSAFSIATLMSGFSHAASTIFNDRSNWQTAVGLSQTIDFSTNDNGSPISNPPADVALSSLTLSGVTFMNVRSYFNQFIYAAGSIHVNLPANTTALGSDLNPLFNSPGTYTVKLSTGEVFTAAAGSVTGVADFFGVVSQTPLQWMEVSLDSSPLVMDNFSFIAPPASLQVRIDIKPGNDNDINPVNPGSNGVIPVSIISTNTFDARTVNPSSVRFGHSGTEAAAASYSIKDSNGDGIPDMVLQFATQSTGIKCGDTTAKLSGQTTSGLQINGSDYIRTVGCN